MKFIVSKKMPTQLNHKVDPVIYEGTDTELVFVASGNTILVYSLQTGVLISTLRSRGSKIAGKTSKAKKDMHKTNIVMLAIRDQPGEGDQASTSTLLSLCS